MFVYNSCLFHKHFMTNLFKHLYNLVNKLISSVFFWQTNCEHWINFPEANATLSNIVILTSFCG